MYSELPGDFRPSARHLRRSGLLYGTALEPTGVQLAAPGEYAPVSTGHQAMWSALFTVIGGVH